MDDHSWIMYGKWSDEYATGIRKSIVEWCVLHKRHEETPCEGPYDNLAITRQLDRAGLAEKE